MTNLSKSMKFQFKNNQGFTIIETLVAVAILMISIVGPLTIAQKGLMSAIYAHDQVTASYLAQDAMEYVKNVRDSNLLNRPTLWLDKLSDCVDVTCSVNTLTGDPNASVGQTSLAGINTCSGTTCRLYLASGNAGYTPSSSGGVASKFSRYFSIKPVINSPKEAKIVVTVSWKAGTIDNAITYESHIFDIIK